MTSGVKLSAVNGRAQKIPPFTFYYILYEVTQRTQLCTTRFLTETLLSFRRIISPYFQRLLLHSCLMDLAYLLPCLSWHLRLGNRGTFEYSHFWHQSTKYNVGTEWRRGRRRGRKPGPTQLHRSPWSFIWNQQRLWSWCRRNWTPYLQRDHFKDQETVAQALSIYIRISAEARQANVSQANSN